MKTFFSKTILTALCLIIFLQIIPAGADYLWDYDSPLAKLYSEKYGTEQIVVLSVGQRMNYADDVSVTLFFSNLSQTDPVVILNKRLAGENWQEIMEEINVGPEVLFRGLDEKKEAWVTINEKTIEEISPFISKEKVDSLKLLINEEIPEKELIEKLTLKNFETEEIERVIFYSTLNKVSKTYRRACKEYEKYREDSSYTIKLYDGEIRDLVQLNFCTLYMEMDYWTVVEKHYKGKDFTDIILEEIEPLSEERAE